jgi:hypothetical protein
MTTIPNERKKRLLTILVFVHCTRICTFLGLLFLRILIVLSTRV